jgi:hypothetical protein
MQPRANIDRLAGKRITEVDDYRSADTLLVEARCLLGSAVPDGGVVIARVSQEVASEADLQALRDRFDSFDHRDRTIIRYDVSHHGEVMAVFTRFKACEDSFIVSDDLVELCLLRDSDLTVKVVADDGAISVV